MIFGLISGSVLSSLIVVGCVMIVLVFKFIFKVMRVIQENYAKQKDSMMGEADDDVTEDFDEEFESKGSAESKVFEGEMVRERKPLKKQPLKSSMVSQVVKADEKDERVKIDFSDKDEVKKAVIMSEIFNRKY